MSQKKSNSLIRTGLKCNHKCLFCTYGNREIKEMSTGEVKERIDRVSDKGTEMIDFTGGEPIIRKDIVEIIKHANQKSFIRIGLQTNGVRFADKYFLNDLIKAGLNFVSISFHSHLKNKYNKITQTENYEQALSALKNLSDSGIKFCVSHVVNKMNYRDILDFIDFISNYNVEHLYFGFIRPNGRTLENKWIVPRLEDVESYVNKGMELSLEKNIDFYFDALPFCYMEKYYKKSSDYYRKNDLLKEVRIDSSRELSDYDNMNSVKKVKSEQCKKCKLDEDCPGIWKEYAEIYGVKELKPVK